jgi:hypothetical protein
MTSAGDTPVKRFRRLVWMEIVALIGISVVTVVPLRFGYPIFGLAPATVADLYFYGSLALIALAQLRYLHPIKTFEVTSWKAYAGGLVVMIGVLAMWFTGSSGRTLDFSNMEQGAVFSPILFAIGLPVIQAITHVIATNSILNQTEFEAGSGPAGTQTQVEWLAQVAEQERAKKPKLSPMVAWLIAIAAQSQSILSRLPSCSR